MNQNSVPKAYLETPIIQRPTRLKLALGWLLLVQIIVSVRVGYSVITQTAIDSVDPNQVACWFILLSAFYLAMLYGVWMLKKWARYLLVPFLALSFLLGIGETLQLNREGLVFLISAATAGLAYRELEKALKINPPIIGA